MSVDESPIRRAGTPGRRNSTEFFSREEQLIKRAERRLVEFELVEHKVVLCLVVITVVVAWIGMLFNPLLIYGSGFVISALAGLAAVLLRRPPR